MAERFLFEAIDLRSIRILGIPLSSVPHERRYACTKDIHIKLQPAKRRTAVDVKEIFGRQCCHTLPGKDTKETRTINSSSNNGNVSCLLSKTKPKPNATNNDIHVPALRLLFSPIPNAQQAQKAPTNTRTTYSYYYVCGHFHRNHLVECDDAKVRPRRWCIARRQGKRMFSCCDRCAPGSRYMKDGKWSN